MVAFRLLLETCGWRLGFSGWPTAEHPTRSRCHRVSNFAAFTQGERKERKEVQRHPRQRALSQTTKPPMQQNLHRGQHYFHNHRSTRPSTHSLRTWAVEQGGHGQRSQRARFLPDLPCGASVKLELLLLLMHLSRLLLLLLLLHLLHLLLFLKLPCSLLFF